MCFVTYTQRYKFVWNTLYNSHLIDILKADKKVTFIQPSTVSLKQSSTSFNTIASNSYLISWGKRLHLVCVSHVKILKIQRLDKFASHTEANECERLVMWMPVCVWWCGFQALLRVVVQSKFEKKNMFMHRGRKWGSFRTFLLISSFRM